MNTPSEYDGYSAQYDSFYLVDTMQWVNSPCSDPHCQWCKNRPPTAHGLKNEIDSLVLVGFDELQ